MKIQRLIFNKVGPLLSQDIALADDWSGSFESRILLTGPNGCGKSTVLRAVAMLWEAFGFWLDYRKALPKNNSTREWLQRWGGCAVVVDGVPGVSQPVGLIFGELDWTESLEKQYPEIMWIGESVERLGKRGAPRRQLLLPDVGAVHELSSYRKRMVLSFEKVSFPNVVYLDAEERRWVTPKRNVGSVVAEDPTLRWQPRYIATEDWKGQLEASLITLKTTQLHLFHEVIRRINQFLAGKEIDPDIRPEENRLRVRVHGQRGVSHTIDDLSAGEHQVLIMITLLTRWAEEGGIVMIDEPDLYLHPSLVSTMLSSIEQIVDDKKGQLIITSHQPEIWQRYELNGKRIELKGIL
jgi:predicted ATPase